MIHIRQKNSSLNPNEAYIVVKTDTWLSDLDQHPSLVDHPESFELVDCDIPKHFQWLSYEPE